MPTPPFIADVRRHYGSGRLMLTGVSGVVVRTDDAYATPRVLLGRRADDGRWALPSGIVEPDEQPARTLVREIFEETRVDVQVQRLALVSTDPETLYPNGDRCQFVCLTFRCHYLSGRAQVGDEESTDVSWRPIDNLPEDLDPIQRRRLDAGLSSASACLFDR